ncbi:MAG: PepSY domain-containing protein [Acidimicrobiia bacterium]|nr:PepSY domain-containing protein [Acidimicrobiia bacterium]
MWHRTPRVLRRLLFQAHRWTGLVAGIYVLAIALSGAVLVFRQEIQAAMYPHYFRVSADGTLADATTVIREVQAAYPGYRVSGVDWPTYRRGTFLAYVSRGNEFRTVFADAETGRVVGELPFDAIRWLQDFHANLRGARMGLTINGIGAALLLLLAASGLFVWIRGVRASWHVTIGALLSPMIVLWALTGMYFAFPQPFRRAVNAVAPLTVVRAPESSPSDPGAFVQPAELIARARAAFPQARLARFVFPFDARGTYVVVLARGVHGDVDTTDEVTLHFDQYTAELLLARDHSRRSAGDTLLAWTRPVHMGMPGGLTGKIVWAIFALAPPALLVTGLAMWRNRTA